MMEKQQNATGKYRIGRWMLLAVMLLIPAVFAGCGTILKQEAKPIENGVLKVGMNLNVPSMCYLSEETSKPEGFEVEVAQKLADKLKLDLEIVDTSEENLLKSLDGDIYDCAISAIGLADWNEEHYGHTSAYADIASVKEKIQVDTENTRIAVFTKKNNALAEELEKGITELKSTGTLKEISEKYFGSDISVKE